MEKLQNVTLKVVGVSFKNESDGSSRQEIIGNVSVKFNGGGMPEVWIEREPTNPFDPNAVKVMTEFGQAGYISKDYAAIIADMIDNQGRTFNVRLGEVGRHKNTNYMSVIIDEK